MPYILLLLLSLPAFAYIKGTPGEVLDQLNIPHNGNGECVYSKRVLNRTSLNRQFSNYVDYRRVVINSPMDIEPHWECAFLKQHLKRDSKYCGVLPDDVFTQLSLYGEPLYKVRGGIDYLGFVRKPYRYDIQVINGKVSLALRIFFKRPRKVTIARYEQMKRIMKSKLLSATRKWTAASRGEFAFNFTVTDSKRDAHFNVKLLDGPTRGPYDKKWSVHWSTITVAHELGHMMGLDDEYDNGRYTLFMKPLLFSLDYDKRFKNASAYTKKRFAYEKTTRCSEKSIMCSSGSGAIKKTHLYQIFKRSYCY
jgi:hypothetical protein